MNNDTWAFLKYPDLIYYTKTVCVFVQEIPKWNPAAYFNIT